MGVAKFFTGPGLIGAGILHFAKPEIYEQIMPRYLPAHRELVYASGVTELLSGAGSLHPATRRPAGILGILTMLGVFPVHVDMIVNNDRYEKVPMWAAWGRIPIQGLFIWWIYKTTLADD